jgi:hypothetical protein
MQIQKRSKSISGTKPEFGMREREGRGVGVKNVYGIPSQRGKKNKMKKMNERFYTLQKTDRYKQVLHSKISCGGQFLCGTVSLIPVGKKQALH